MEFKKIGKISVGLIAGLGVLGLITIFFTEGKLGLGSGVPLEHDFGRLNSARLFLMAWESFWLTSSAIFFIMLARKAKTKKTEEQVETLEHVEPLVFKIIMIGLIIAALLTLVLPIFVGPNTLSQYNTHDVGTEINVHARAFQWTINGVDCKTSDQPDATCITLSTGVRYIFVLQSADTTHGFTVYDDNNVLLTQAQVVPDHVTRLAFTFDTTGDYSIRCAEYCGSSHHGMLASFTVVDGGN